MAWDKAYREIAHSAAGTLTPGHAEQSRGQRKGPGWGERRPCPAPRVGWPRSQHLLIQVNVQGPVRIIGIFVVLVTGQGILRDDRNAVSGSTHPAPTPSGPHLPSQRQTSKSTPMRASDLGPGAQRGQGIRTVNVTEVLVGAHSSQGRADWGPGGGVGWAADLRHLLGDDVHALGGRDVLIALRVQRAVTPRAPALALPLLLLPLILLQPLPVPPLLLQLHVLVR